MSKLCKRLAFCSALMAGLWLSSLSSARATIYIIAEDTTNSVFETFTAPSGGALTPFAFTSISGFNFTGGGSVQDNATGTPGGALITQTNLNTSSTAGDSLKLWVSDTSFTQPVGPGTLSQSIGISSLNAGTNGQPVGTPGSLSGVADYIASPVTPTTGNPLGAGTVTATLPVTFPGFVDASTGGVSGGDHTAVTTTSVPFSLGQTITLVDTAAGQVLSETDTVSYTATPAVPAPSDLMLLVSSSPVLGLGYWLRRRRARAAA